MLTAEPASVRAMSAAEALGVGGDEAFARPAMPEFAIEDDPLVVTV